MAVQKRASAVPRKAAATRKAAVANGGSTTDLVGVRMTALNYARSLYGTGGNIGDPSGASGAPEPVTTASKLVTQAKRIERYILGTEAGEDV